MLDFKLLKFRVTGLLSLAILKGFSLTRRSPRPYSQENLNRWIIVIKKLFPSESDRNVFFLSEKIQLLSAKSYVLSQLEHKFFENTFRLVPKDLSALQLEFYEKYVAFLQGVYSTLAATMLFLKKSNSLDVSHVSTGKSTKKFLESCRSFFADKVHFDLLYQSTIIRSLLSDHIQDGKLEWGTVGVDGVFYALSQSPEMVEWVEKKGYNGKFSLILHSMFSEGYKKDVDEQLEKLFFIKSPMPGFFCPHHSDIFDSYMSLIISLSKQNTKVKANK